MFYVLRCPKCYVYRTGEAKNKSWRCYRCQYNMNRKNTKIQAKANTIKEVQFVLNKLQNPKG